MAIKKWVIFFYEVICFNDEGAGVFCFLWFTFLSVNSRMQKKLHTLRPWRSKSLVFDWLISRPFVNSRSNLYSWIGSICCKMMRAYCFYHQSFRMFLWRRKKISKVNKIIIDIYASNIFQFYLPEFCIDRLWGQIYKNWMTLTWREPLMDTHLFVPAGRRWMDSGFYDCHCLNS